MTAEPKAEFTLDDLRQWQESGGADLTPPAKLSVFGDPVSHSLSPQLHNPALKDCGIDAQYIRIHVPPGSVRAALEAIRGLGFFGTNVTVPHKLEAMQAMDEVDDLARQLGAVNTVVFDDSLMLGFNSDGPGFVRAIRDEFNVDLSDLRILILGAGGGAGRAVAVQCAIESCERLVLANRTVEKAESLRDELRPRFRDSRLLGATERLAVAEWSEAGLRRELDNIDLIVNATSLGMRRTDPDLVPPSLLEPHHMIFDMVYSPLRTRLMNAAESAGARSANGLSMLVHQGAISFEHWFSQPAPIETMRKAVAEAARSSFRNR